MFDNLKETISAAESVLSDIQYAKESALTSVQYYTEKRDEYVADHPNDTDLEYYDLHIRENKIKVEMFDAIEKTVAQIVRQALK